MKIIAQTYVAICTKFWMTKKKKKNQHYKTETLNVAGQPILNSLTALSICFESDIHQTWPQQVHLIKSHYGSGPISILHHWDLFLHRALWSCYKKKTPWKIWSTFGRFKTSKWKILDGSPGNNYIQLCWEWVGSSQQRVSIMCQIN